MVKTQSTANVSKQQTYVYKKSLVDIQKRDGQIVEYDDKKIAIAVSKAFQETSEGDERDARYIAHRVTTELMRVASQFKSFTPTVEAVQDEVERQLMNAGFTETAKAYILYRQERLGARIDESRITPDIRQAVGQSSQYFTSSYQEFIFYKSYSRWNEQAGRRETWSEAVQRFIDFMRQKMGNKLTEAEYQEVELGILNQEVNPSMRLLWSAGKAAAATNVAAYNCAYIAPTSWQDMAEIMYVSMCGAGCGFSVEPENVEQFPQIKKQTGKIRPTIVVDDSKEGWCDAFAAACDTWANGYDVEIDYGKLRPAGAPLNTMGGRSSGPEPLRELMEFTKRRLLSRQGRRLSTLDIHDIICQIGLIVVAGGVRRSALISMSALDDQEMRDSKKGAFWQTNGQRSMANNSAVYESKPSAAEFLEEWTALVSSGTGERGIFNRGGLEKQMTKRRWQSIQGHRAQIGMNPCGEIYLRSKQFCNLTSIVVRPDDDMKSLKRKMRLATILGTYQATLIDFPYLSEEWQKNCQEEQLLGVSITGYYDNEIVRNDHNLATLRQEGVKINQQYAKRFGVNSSTAITCVKPHGQSGQLLGVGSGMHPWFSKYFIRRVRMNVNDPLLELMKDQGVPMHPEVGYSSTTTTTMVLDFPMKAPEGAVVADDVSAIEMLTEWKRLKEHFTEHNPSVTIYVGDDEWLEVANFVYKNWDMVGGLSFLPRTDHVYQLAPYEAISQERYEQLVKDMKSIDFSRLVLYENNDQTEGAKELACVGGVCEI